jgi:Ni,Fe-hydrogenase III large subunit
MKHCLAEMIAGDSSIAHTNAYANVIESLGGVEASLKTNTIRTIALELERAGIHIGDLGAIANDIAYLLGTRFMVQQEH